MELHVVFFLLIAPVGLAPSVDDSPFQHERHTIHIASTGGNLVVGMEIEEKPRCKHRSVLDSLREWSVHPHCLLDDPPLRRALLQGIQQDLD